jgi:RimK family alpha-L-glutamate ligase
MSMLRPVRQFLIAGDITPTNVGLLEALRLVSLDANLLPVDGVLRRARPGDVVLARLDVRPTLDGVDSGVYELERLQARGVHVLNDTAALFAAHDKLATAIRLDEALLPHPSTSLADERPPELPPPPVVVKPRFGSWGQDVVLCRTKRELRRTLRGLRDREWFRRQGALVQALVPPRGEDLRVVVAGDTVIGAIKRVAQPGEWRTNVALGARRVPTDPPAEARELALAAAFAIGADLVGVDLLPTPDGYVIIELNGCVDFTEAYSLDGRSVFTEAAESLLARADAFSALELDVDAPVLTP